MVKYLPAAGLGGDYYDIFEMGDRKHFGVLIADSKTHGMAAALLSVLLKTRIEEMKDRFPESRAFVEYLNAEIQQMNQKALSQLALLYGIFDRSTLTFRYTSAGHLKPLLWRGGRPEPLPPVSNPPLGGVDRFAFRECAVTLRPGDLLIFHTDGLEGPLTDRHPSAFEKMVEILKDKEPRPDPLDVQNELMALVDRSIERKPLEDDLTMIHLSIDEKTLYIPASTTPVSTNKG
jgi:serine phosphatase RsbU (regulator of sigma subunit)